MEEVLSRSILFEPVNQTPPPNKLPEYEPVALVAKTDTCQALLLFLSLCFHVAPDLSTGVSSILPTPLVNDSARGHAYIDTDSANSVASAIAVSYTHLTLPTKA